MLYSASVFSQGEKKKKKKKGPTLAAASHAGLAWSVVAIFCRSISESLRGVVSSRKASFAIGLFSQAYTFFQKNRLFLWPRLALERAFFPGFFPSFVVPHASGRPHKLSSLTDTDCHPKKNGAGFADGFGEKVETARGGKARTCIYA
nr:hypothetical protein [Pandoravirus massiliensis]